MDAQQSPFTWLATVTQVETVRPVKNRSYNRVSFWASIDEPSYIDGDDFRNGRPCWFYVEGTKEVADVIAAHDGLQPGERIYIRIVRFDAFGGGDVDDRGNIRKPVKKLIIDHIELPGRAFKNQSLKKMATKVAAKDATIAAQSEVLAGVTK